MVLTSEEINIIIYKYLQESGFRHTSFAFQFESQVEKSTYRDAPIQPGALINIIHKGLQFMEIEAHMNEEGELVECNVPFSLLEPHTCHVNTDEAENEPALPSSSKSHALSNSSTAATSSSTAVTATTSTKRKSKEEKRQQKDREKRAKKEALLEDEEMPVNNRVKEESKNENSLVEKKTNGTSTTSSLAAASQAVARDLDEEMAEVQPNSTEIRPEDVVILQGHQSEVFSCAWNPVVSSLLASGSGDATARLWEVPEGRERTAEPIVLNHLPNMNDNKDVTTLDWNPTGSLLVTGSYDGQARIWTQKGQLRFVMGHHRGPIFSLKWNMSGDLVLSGSADTTTIVWDPETGEMKQQFELHTLAILDVDWMDNTTFASCSSDKTIYVCKVGSTKPLKKWVGHEDEVNAVRWDPTGQYLASCSDDMTTKIWSMASDEPIQEIKGHNLQIYTLQWAPYTQKDTSSSSPRILATASFDATVRIWDALKGTCLHVLKNHSEAVYSISFSPDARLLASGSFDEVLNVWDAKDGSLKKTFKADGGIFEVHFNKTGDKLAACTSNKQVVILNHMKN
ncbi:WD40-repeat-containing domain protein [Mucor lusitanicus]|uniref:WD40-repeat-containing domain protein n=1 Tax=Mucor circinelloides f. lusitanicus TaxID=29924 RepID=A0A8H4BCQ3_MUCCL|nr:WD40-repeat-containing domain protein [Mucor lusitanicus]